MAFCMAALAACSGKSSAGTSGSTASTKGADRGYDFYIFNAKGENAAQFDAMAQAYQAETGVRVKTFSIGAGAEQNGPLTTEMNSKNMPTIYSIQGINNLAMWLDGGYVVDLNSVNNNAAFQKLAADIAPSLRMSTGNNTSYGIPYNVEGYGFIVDRQMIADLFGANNADAALEDIRLASYDEWETFVNTLDNWIKSAAPLAVTLNGTSYTLADTKTALTEKLNGVFVIMGSQTWTYGGHLVNVALNCVFDNDNAALTATESQIQSLRGPLLAYIKTLDLKTSHLAGKTGPVTRNQELVSDANFGYDQAVQIFADGKALFLKQGNWAYNNIANADKAMAERLAFLPVKMPFTQSDITRSGVTVAQLNRSIPVFVPNYYAVNALCSDEEKQHAYNFLVWMNTTAAGQRFVVDEMAFIPYNADPATTTLPNSLGNSIIDYMKSDSTLGGQWLGAPGPWAGDRLGAFVRESYLIKPQWSEADYTTVVNYGVDEWVNLSK
jgi:raffinose/stachyose/melibiose transport system substrate-binding protein